MADGREVFAGLSGFDASEVSVGREMAAGFSGFGGSGDISGFAGSDGDTGEDVDAVGLLTSGISRVGFRRAAGFEVTGGFLDMSVDCRTGIGFAGDLRPSNLDTISVMDPFLSCAGRVPDLPLTASDGSLEDDGREYIDCGRLRSEVWREDCGRASTMGIVADLGLEASRCLCSGDASAVLAFAEDDNSRMGCLVPDADSGSSSSSLVSGDT